MSETKIPSAAELDAWLEMLRGGYASKEMLPRVIDGYKRLLKVAEAARQLVELTDDAPWRGEIALRNTLDALEAPVPETEGK